jgi:hypothetical protein
MNKNEHNMNLTEKGDDNCMTFDRDLVGREKNVN